MDKIKQLMTTCEKIIFIWDFNTGSSGVDSIRRSGGSSIPLNATIIINPDGI